MYILPLTAAVLDTGRWGLIHVFKVKVSMLYLVSYDEESRQNITVLRVWKVCVMHVFVELKCLYAHNDGIHTRGRTCCFH